MNVFLLDSWIALRAALSAKRHWLEVVHDS